MRLRTETIHDGMERVLEPFLAYGVSIPAGFEFDGASTPRLFWSILPPFKDTKIAACIHDYLCIKAQTPEDRKYADWLFHEILKHQGRISGTRAWIGYAGVRIGAFLGIGVRYQHWTDVFKRKKRKVA